VFPQSLEISTQRARDGVTIVARGELDVAAAPELTAILDAALWEDTRVRRVVLDLSQLTFCDSSGLKVLLTGYRLAALNGTAFEIVVVDGPVRDLIALSGFDSVLPLTQPAAPLLRVVS
jgi:anti-anti-sigma factor